MIAKPIVVMRIPDSYFGDPDDDYRRLELMRYLEDNKTDYHWFVLPQPNPMEDITFEVFYEKDHQPISHEELKQLILDSVKEKGHE